MGRADAGRGEPGTVDRPHSTSEPPARAARVVSASERRIPAPATPEIRAPARAGIGRRGGPSGAGARTRIRRRAPPWRSPSERPPPRRRRSPRPIVLHDHDHRLRRQVGVERCRPRHPAAGPIRPGRGIRRRCPGRYRIRPAYSPAACTARRVDSEADPTPGRARRRRSGRSRPVGDRGTGSLEIADARRLERVAHDRAQDAALGQVALLAARALPGGGRPPRAAHSGEACPPGTATCATGRRGAPPRPGCRSSIPPIPSTRRDTFPRLMTATCATWIPSRAWRT